MTAQLTVVIPLFKGKKWLPGIIQNVRAIPSDARVVISDGVSSDDTVPELARIFADDPRVVTRLRSDEVGWRAHCNGLIAECETPYFSILPQDDLIQFDYYQLLLESLRVHEQCGVAFGTIYMANDLEVESARCMLGAPTIANVGEPWQEALRLDRQWNLGIPFRGVIRRRVLRPIAATPGDTCADQLWVFGMALTSYLLEVAQARYLKRYHSDNTHGAWRPLMGQERQAYLENQIQSVLTGAQQMRALQALRAMEWHHPPLTGSFDQQNRYG